MEKIYDERCRRSLKRELTAAALAAAVVLLLGAAAALIILSGGPLTVPRALLGAGATGAALLAAAWTAHKRLLPLWRVRRLLAGLDLENTVTVRGVFRGYGDTLATHGGVLTRRLRVDAGDSFRGERYERELELPAVCAQPSFVPGQEVELETAENIVVAARPGFSAGPVRGKDGAYALPFYVCAILLAVSVLTWLAVYSAAGTGDAAMPRLAVVAPAHNEEMDMRVSAAAGVEIGYSNTLNAQEVAQYLATYGTFEADIIVLGETYFQGVYYGEAALLDPEALQNALGFSPKYMEGADGEALAVVLYDPADEGYSARFPGLYDWFAVEAGTPLLMMIRSDSPYAEGGRAQEAVLSILKTICEK